MQSRKGSYTFALLLTKHIRIVPWCNGSTSDFGSVSPGSNPSGTTILKTKTVYIFSDVNGFFIYSKFNYICQMKNLTVILSFLLLLSFSAKAQLNTSPKSDFMIRHTVVFKLKYPKGSMEEKKFFSAANKLSSISVVHNFEAFRETSEKNDYDYCFYMEFESMKAYNEYNQHPVHTEFVEKYWGKYVDKFLEIDYEPIK